MQEFRSKGMAVIELPISVWGSNPGNFGHDGYLPPVLYVSGEGEVGSSQESKLPEYQETVVCGQ